MRQPARTTSVNSAHGSAQPAKVNTDASAHAYGSVMQQADRLLEELGLQERRAFAAVGPGGVPPPFLPEPVASETSRRNGSGTASSTFTPWRRIGELTSSPQAPAPLGTPARNVPAFSPLVDRGKTGLGVSTTLGSIESFDASALEVSAQQASWRREEWSPQVPHSPAAPPIATARSPRVSGTGLTRAADVRGEAQSPSIIQPFGQASTARERAAERAVVGMRDQAQMWERQAVDLQGRISTCEAQHRRESLDCRGRIAAMEDSVHRERLAYEAEMVRLRQASEVEVAHARHVVEDSQRQARAAQLAGEERALRGQEELKNALDGMDRRALQKDNQCARQREEIVERLEEEKKRQARTHNLQTQKNRLYAEALEARVGHLENELAEQESIVAVLPNIEEELVRETCAKNAAADYATKLDDELADARTRHGAAESQLQALGCSWVEAEEHRAELREDATKAAKELTAAQANTASTKTELIGQLQNQENHFKKEIQTYQQELEDASEATLQAQLLGESHAAKSLREEVLVETLRSEVLSQKAKTFAEAKAAKLALERSPPPEPLGAVLRRVSPPTALPSMYGFAQLVSGGESSASSTSSVNAKAGSLPVHPFGGEVIPATSSRAKPFRAPGQGAGPSSDAVDAMLGWSAACWVPTTSDTYIPPCSSEDAGVSVAARAGSPAPTDVQRPVGSNGQGTPPPSDLQQRSSTTGVPAPRNCHPVLSPRRQGAGRLPTVQELEIATGPTDSSKVAAHRQGSPINRGPCQDPTSPLGGNAPGEEGAIIALKSQPAAETGSIVQHIGSASPRNKPASEPASPRNKPASQAYPELSPRSTTSGPRLELSPRSGGKPRFLSVALGPGIVSGRVPSAASDDVGGRTSSKGSIDTPSRAALVAQEWQAEWNAEREQLFRAIQLGEEWQQRSETIEDEHKKSLERNLLAEEYMHEAARAQEAEHYVELLSSQQDGHAWKLQTQFLQNQLEYASQFEAGQQTLLEDAKQDMVNIHRRNQMLEDKVAGVSRQEEAELKCMESDRETLRQRIMLLEVRLQRADSDQQQLEEIHQEFKQERAALHKAEATSQAMQAVSAGMEEQLRQASVEQDRLVALSNELHADNRRLTADAVRSPGARSLAEVASALPGRPDWLPMSPKKQAPVGSPVSSSRSSAVNADADGQTAKTMPGSTPLQHRSRSTPLLGQSGGVPSSFSHFVHSARKTNGDSSNRSGQPQSPALISTSARGFAQRRAATGLQLPASPAQFLGKQASPTHYDLLPDCPDLDNSRAFQASPTPWTKNSSFQTALQSPGVGGGRVAVLATSPSNR